MKVLFVINPRSGRQEVTGIETLIEDQAHFCGCEYKIHTMQGQNVAADIRKEIENFKPDIVAAAGGDGTVNLMTGILANTEMTLLIIPYGSANGMAKELGIGNRVDAAIALLGSGKTRSIDLMNVNGKICIHLADVGVNARIVKRFEEDPKRGIITYAKHLFNEMFLLKQYRFYIHYDGKSIIRKAVSLTFANASRYGTGAVINPKGVLDDEKVELIIVKPFPQIKLLSIAWKMFTNKLQTSEYVEVICCSKATVISSRKTTLQVDGEIIGRFKEFEVEVLPKALKVLVPKEQGGRSKE